MQVWLKRNPLFKNDTETNSIVKKGTELDNMITLFEEKSRNYTGIDFSNIKVDPKKVAEAKKELGEAQAKEKAREKLYKNEKADLDKKLGKAQKIKDRSKIQTVQTAINDAMQKYLDDITKLKDNTADAEDALIICQRAPKVLVAGFDPFILNEFDNQLLLNVTTPNILQSNPSGCVALDLVNQMYGFVQALIVPVRYKDFDGSHQRDDGQGEGIIEKYLRPWIKEVDMIITVSQSNPNDYNVDKYATVTRGGFNDNMDFIRMTGSKALSGIEWIETTLPQGMTNAPFVKYDWSYDGKDGRVTPPKKADKIDYGSGGSYLSNEIFYRVAKLRDDMRPSLNTGHFHISKIQGVKEKLKQDEIKEVLKIVRTAITEAMKSV